MEQVRVGIVGTSGWAQMLVLPAFSAHPRARVAAICGRDRGRAEEAARKFDVPAVYTDYREMYERAGLDAVVVSSPDDLHYPMTMAALAAGLHVLCEKPMALTAADARAMLARAAEAGVKHMVNFTWRTTPTYQYMRELIAEGYLGLPYQCAFRFDAGFGRQGDYRWRFDRRRANGALGGSGSHMADLARWLIGDIAAVSATLSTFVHRPGVDNQPPDPANDAATLALRFANGAQGTVAVSAVAHLGDRIMHQQAILHGEAGTLEADVSFGHGWELRGARSGETQIRPLPIPDRIAGRMDAAKPPLARLIERAITAPVGPRTFIDAIVEDRQADPSFADGVRAQEVIEAALRSDASGCWEPLP